MRLKKLAFNGLFSYATESVLELSERVVFVGPNNSGKSNLFKIIQILSDSLRSDGRLESSMVSQLCDDNPYIDADIDLSDDEARVLVDFLKCGNDGSRLHMMSLSELDQAYRVNQISIRVAWRRMHDGSGDNARVIIKFPNCGFALRGEISDGILHAEPLNATSDAPDRSHAPQNSQSLNTFLRMIFETHNPANSAHSSLRNFHVVVHNPVVINKHNLGKIDDYHRSQILGLLHKLGVEGAVTLSLPLVIGILLSNHTVYVADNSGSVSLHAKDEFGYRGYGGDGPNAPKRDATLAEKIVASLAYAETLERGGHNMAQFLFSLKNSPRLSDIKRYQTIRKEFKGVFGSTVDVFLKHRRIPTSDEYVSVPTPEISITDDGLLEHVRLEQVGAGARSVLYLLTATLGVRDSITMLDEPGANLHPQLLQAVMNALAAAQSTQIFVVTHSPTLLQYEIIRGASVVYVRTEGPESFKSSTIETAENPESNIKMLMYRIDPSVFFARLVILVEGPSDSALLCLSHDKSVDDPKYDLASNNITVVSVGGNTGFKTHTDLLDAYNIPWVALSDKDSEHLFKADISRISENGIDGDGPVYLLSEDLEAWMESMDPDTFKEAQSRSKPQTAILFCKFTTKPEAMRPVLDFLKTCVDKACNA